MIGDLKINLDDLEYEEWGYWESALEKLSRKMEKERFDKHVKELAEAYGITNQGESQ